MHETSATLLLRLKADGEVRGVRYRDADNAWHEVRAELTVAADGRFSKVRHLAGIERYLSEQAAAQAFGALLDLLFGRVLPTLECFPEVGPDFLARRPQSVDGFALRRALPIHDRP